MRRRGTKTQTGTWICLPLLAGAVLLQGCAGPQSALQADGEEAEAIVTLLWVTTIGGAVIWLAVVGAMLFAIRRRRHALSERGARSLILWCGVVLPSFILFALLAFTLWRMPMARPWFDPGDQPVTIEVTGEQFWWRLRYLDDKGDVLFETANELRMPVGERVRFLLKAHDVIHSFWIPALGGKMDMIPGRTNVLSLKATRTGVYRGPCVEFCGTSHALMNIDAEVVEKAEFDRWVERQRPAGSGSETNNGEAFLKNGCGGCHAVRGTEATGELGPDLTNFAARKRIGAGTAANTVENRRRFVRNAGRMKPGVQMPAYETLPEAELDAIVAYLGGLR